MVALALHQKLQKKLKLSLKEVTLSSATARIELAFFFRLIIKMTSITTVSVVHLDLRPDVTDCPWWLVEEAYFDMKEHI